MARQVRPLHSDDVEHRRPDSAHPCTSIWHSSLLLWTPNGQHACLMLTTYCAGYAGHWALCGRLRSSRGAYPPFLRARTCWEQRTPGAARLQPLPCPFCRSWRATPLESLLWSSLLLGEMRGCVKGSLLNAILRRLVLYWDKVLEPAVAGLTLTYSATLLLHFCKPVLRVML